MAQNANGKKMDTWITTCRIRVLRVGVTVSYENSGVYYRYMHRLPCFPGGQCFGKVNRTQLIFKSVGEKLVANNMPEKGKSTIKHSFQFLSLSL